MGLILRRKRAWHVLKITPHKSILVSASPKLSWQLFFGWSKAGQIPEGAKGISGGTMVGSTHGTEEATWKPNVSICLWMA